MAERKKVGEHAYDLLTKQEGPVNVLDQQEAMQSSWQKEINQAIERGKKTINDDFYLVIETKKERLMPNVLRNYFILRRSCPTPASDQVVYKFHNKDERLEFLWVLPSIDSMAYLKMHSLALPPQEHQILGYVLAFQDGSLLRRAKQYNHEKIDSPFLH